MKDWSILRARYQQDALAVQVGGLASNLNRIAWCAERSSREEAMRLFRESKYFTEWAAPSCTMDQQSLLAELQLQLALWERDWGCRVSPSAIADEAKRWSAKLLESSGLLNA